LSRSPTIKIQEALIVRKWAPVRCAVEVAHAIRQGHLALALRMGIHGGPAFSIVDIGGNRNATGAGINVAQRVMNCGNIGHLLLSKVAADFLPQLSDYADYVKDLGEFEVKHGEQLQVYNFYSFEFGNSLRPVSQSQPSKII
jgi:class 3 adenylate cyclase